MSISKIIQQIKTAGGKRTEKIAILKKNKNNEEFKKMLLYAYNPYMMFNVVKIADIDKKQIVSDSEQWEQFFAACDKSSKRNTTGNAAIAMFQKVFQVSDDENVKIMKNVLKKHLNIGISVSTINSVFPNLIPEFDVMLAEPYDETRINSDVVLAFEPKLDGVRCLTIVKNNEATMFSRGGKLIENFKHISDDLAKLKDGVYDGELMGTTFDDLMTVYKTKGVSTIQYTYHIFDYIEYNEWMSCKFEMSLAKRRDALENLRIQEMTTTCKVVERQYGKLADIDRVMKHYVKLGYEGLMIKSLEAPYQKKRTYDIMKKKNFLDIDAAIVSLYKGEEFSRIQDVMGGAIINVGDKNKPIYVEIGSGWSDDLRKKMWENPDDYIGKIIQVSYQEVTKAGSLRFPTFMRFRDDKQMDLNEK